MGYHLGRFDKAVAPHLEPGEQVVGGTWARTPGGFAKERAFGIAGAIAAQVGEGEAGSVRLPKAFELAVTEHRLLIFERSVLTGRPSTLVVSVPLTEVVAAELTQSRQAIHSAAVRLRNGGSIDFEVAKAGARKLIEGFVTCVNDQLGRIRSATSS